MRSYKGAAPKRKLFMGAAPEYKLCAAPRHLIHDALECGKVEESHKKPDTSKKAPGRSAPMRQAQKRRAASPERESSESDDQSERHESEVEKLINEQNPDGSWDSSTKINDELVRKYNQKVAATIASIAFIRKNSGPALNSFKLIIKKALNFLQKFDSSVDWESIIDEEITKI